MESGEKEGNNKLFLLFVFYHVLHVKPLNICESYLYLLQKNVIIVTDGKIAWALYVYSIYNAKDRDEDYITTIHQIKEDAEN